nr:unnamed protein product [Callosobruchus analis]
MFIKHTLNGEFIEVNVGKRGSRLADQKTLKDLKRKYNGLITLNDKNSRFEKANEAVVEDEQLSNDSVEDIDGDEEIHDME